MMLFCSLKKCVPLVILGTFFLSCSVDDDAGNIMQDLAPIISVNLPESFVFEETFEIELTYRKPTSCHNYSGLDLARNGNVIVVGVVTSFNTTTDNCESSGNLEATTSINFVAERNDFYIFKFWKGRTAGRDEFLIVEVPVTQPEMN